MGASEEEEDAPMFQTMRCVAGALLLLAVSGCAGTSQPTSAPPSPIASEPGRAETILGRVGEATKSVGKAIGDLTRVVDLTR
jgi:hypothetical protein